MSSRCWPTTWPMRRRRWPPPGGLLDYGAKGELEGRLACAFTAEMVHDLITRLIGREELWGLEPAPMRAAHPFLATFRSPEVLASFADQPGPRHLDADFEMVQDTFRAFADKVIKPRAEHVHRFNEDVPEEVISGLAEMGAFGLSVPRRLRGVQRGRRRRVHGHGGGHRGAQPWLAGDRRLADHPPRDPHPRPGEGRHRGAEAVLAAEVGQRRGDGCGGCHRARLRQRRGRHQGHRHGGRRARRRTGVRDQRGQDVVHVRRARRRPHAPGTQRARAEGPPRAEPVHRPQAARRGPRLRLRPGPDRRWHHGEAGGSGDRHDRLPRDAQLRGGPGQLVGAGDEPDRRGRGPRQGLLLPDGGASRTAGCRPPPGRSG